MDVINKLHSCFRDVQHFEFGDNYVKFYDSESEKYYKIQIVELNKDIKQVEKSILNGQGLIKKAKLTKDSPEVQKWLKGRKK